MNYYEQQYIFYCTRRIQDTATTISAPSHQRAAAFPCFPACFPGDPGVRRELGRLPLSPVHIIAIGSHQTNRLTTPQQSNAAFTRATEMLAIYCPPFGGHLDEPLLTLEGGGMRDYAGRAHRRTVLLLWALA